MALSFEIPVRLGGDDSIVLLPETGIERTIPIAEKITESSREIHGDSEPVYFSVGISEWGPAIESVEAFLEVVDLVLYEAKNAGGQRIRAGDRLVLAWGQASI